MKDRLALLAAISCLLPCLPGCGELSPEDELTSETTAGLKAEEDAAGPAAEDDTAKALARPVLDKGFLAHNRAISDIVGGCWYTVQHGNYLGAAYAKIMSHTSGCSVQPKVTGLRADHTWPTDYGVTERRTGFWTQAQVNYANIIGSDFIINGWVVRYAGI